MKVYPNVKINLGLHVLRRRPDGYHDIETLFLPYFGMSDCLEITPSRGREGTFRIDGGDWPAESDLAVRAWHLLEKDFDLPPVDICLEKRTPVGAGLGSGSSDAAFTLRAVSEMFSLGLSDERLAGYAARIGSDCAFFIYNRPMLGRGRGEQLSPFGPVLDGFGIRVGIPDGVRVSTREAYSGLAPREPGVGRPPLLDALARPVQEWKDCLVNDFEQSVFSLHPEIRALKERMYAEGAVYASMSGSGSAVFGVFPL